MSINQTAWITVLTFSLFLAGCGKPEISADCNIKGAGDAHCVFHNKGSGKGSTCVNIALSDDSTASSTPDSNFSEIASLFGSSEHLKKIGFDEDVRSFISLLGIDSSLNKDIAPDTSFEDRVKIDNFTSEKFTKLSAQQRIAAKQAFEKLKKISIEHPYSQVRRFSDSALCSGNLDAGDVSERNALASFEGLRPTSVCRHWPDGCSMTTVNANDLAKTKENHPSLNEWYKNVDNQIRQAFPASS